ncbi:prolyl oligopeptidase family serine peptidase [Sphingobacterium sp. UT-1RO-CII-1]|nr:prolyl oligopeptidase family serine peptidase [Sphingobacterium sp. UT-1RO-CII-1]
MLKTPDDEANFETLAKSELYWVTLDGSQSKFKDAAIYGSLSFSPDGNYILATTIERPYSYVVALYSFPQNSVVYDIDGNLIKEVNKVPLIEIQPKGFSSTRTGKRNMYWRADKPASLYYVEALDGGDATKSADFRDELYTWDAPFTSQATSLMKLNDRFAGVLWGDDNNAIVSTSFYDTRSDKRYLLNPRTGESKLLLERNSQDVYSHPGSVHMERNAFGRYVMYIDKNKIYWTGPGFSKEGQFPFIEEQDLKNLAKKRLYTSEYKDKKEDIISITDIKRQQALVSIQSATEYPNYYLRDLKKNKLDTLTRFENPFKSLANVHKEVINYKRSDGVDLSGTLYLPAGYDRNAKNQKLPLLIWAYPTEFNSKDAAGQSTANPNSFTFPSYGSFIYWVSKGYAVLDDASFPIIGEKGTEPNDTFIEQLVANGKAAIDAVDELGYIDRSKVGVGGHSYGAFMVAHLLSNSDLFAAGVARSGAYNRTLTPFGFQREQRNYWDNPELYNTMSPFMSANRMKTPILLIHGNADNNPGTFTLQTERYFQALKNLGAPARMVLLPLESHGYAAEESIMHTLWEQDQFLEKYLK